MGYACPVCGAEEVDAVHLANHLAVTASLGREDHVEWLEAHAPDWHEKGPEDLGATVADYAPEVETPDFEGGQGASPSIEAELAAEGRRPGRGAMAGGSVPDGVLREARELTAEMERRRERGGKSGDRVEPAVADEETDTEDDAGIEDDTESE